jgi:hypothetical protein
MKEHAESSRYDGERGDERLQRERVLARERMGQPVAAPEGPVPRRACQWP